MMTCAEHNVLDAKYRILLKLTYLVRRNFVKNARSVSLYPYNQSQILQYVKYTK